MTFAESMFAAGFTDLIPVIPPGASLAPSSKIAPASIGKIPGRRSENGMWGGFDWRALVATADDVRTWGSWGANIGLRADRFPGVDIDCTDESVAQIIEDAALAMLGYAPVRVGRWPKRLLMYRTAAPFGRRRLWMKRGEESHLVEILGAGQQYLVAGTHPTTLRPYQWGGDPAASTLTEIDAAQADRFLTHVQEAVEMLGFTCKRAEGSANVARRADQSSLQAPSIDELRKVVELIPNTLNTHPGWDEYVKMLMATRAAAGPDEEDGHDIFAAWAAKWEGHGMRHADSNDPDAVRALWRRTRGPFALGWGWLCEQARPYGYMDDADFPVEGSAPEAGQDEIPGAPYLSDQWLAVRVVNAQLGVLRYSPAQSMWYVWNKGRWQPDAEMLAEDTVKLELRRIADRIAREGVDDKAKAKNYQKAVEICSAAKVGAVSRLVQMDRNIAVAPEALDFNQWILNTPGGIIDLKTGELRDSDPDQLCTRATAVTPDFKGAHPQWDRFLDEATGGDRELVGYLQRLAGYALTGSTEEQQYAFIYGPGGNGKGVFLKVLMGVLGSYHKDSPMETFVASSNDRHPTELASLAGARLVTASETEAGKRWDESKLKRMTGGDPITARHMREDFFTYVPQFKLIFVGNHKPEIRNLDEAMRRRTHLVPFMVKPAVVDKRLDDKLRAEWPAILGWMVDGCLAWQQQGLNPPQSVTEATADYFDESDPVGQWMAECTEPAADEWVSLVELFRSWSEWVHDREGRDGYVGKIQAFASRLQVRGLVKGKDPKKRSVRFRGVKIIGQNPLECVA